MKTPDGKDMNVLSETLEKVKKGLECCGKDGIDPCNGCPYGRIGDDEWKCGLNADVLFCIEQLEEERDAAVDALRNAECLIARALNGDT